MAKINILPEHLAMLIAAGEVVERPASVIKELMENSIDAGSRKITVEIKNGGVRYMRITDDGCGIEREDIRAAFISHATSKIKFREDLDSILTLGFRGEALASVSSVARVEVMTRTADSDMGTRYLICGGKEEELDDAGCPLGTTMIIRDLFYNTPARMKFLKKDVTEGNYVSEAVNKIALSHPEISVTLIKDNKRTLFTPGDGRLITVINEIFGSDFGGGLIECEGETEGVSVKGYISKPVHSRPNRSMQHCFVNGRYVKLPVASSALDNAYKNRIMVGKYPACVLFLTVNPGTVDVNVHPAKTQVRFSNDKVIYDAVYFSAVSALQKKDEPVAVKLARKDIGALFRENTSVNQVEIKAPAEKISLSIDTVSAESKPEPPPIENMYRGVKKEFRPEFYPKPKKTPIPFYEETVTVRQPDLPEFVYEEDEGAAVLNMKPEKTEEASNEIVSAKEPEAAKTEAADEPVRIIGEVFSTYILAEQKGKMIFVDKHAVHERIIFNRLKNREKEVYSQLLMSPIRVTLSAKDYSAVISNLEIFRKSGFDIEDFGEGTVIVRECPTELSDGDIGEIVLEMADKLSRFSSNPESEKEDWLYHSTACRAAVKAGDRLTALDMEKLVNTALNDRDVRYCPHGRPVLFTMTEYEIKKLFGRNG